MAATAGSVTVDCPECSEEITIELHLHTLPRTHDKGPLHVEVEPDLGAIRAHVERAHA
ncbi:hypothetical protein [Streptomyces sp. P9-1]|jgi:hypothetical protein|uniref:hypothetical protein n=1 Tax=Streptomyces sp. P9-1 TaxID=3422589 RepID=UPI003D36C4E5